MEPRSSLEPIPEKQQEPQEQRSGEGARSALVRLRQQEKAKADGAPRDERSS